MSNVIRFGDKLIKLGVITEDHLKLALRKQRKTGQLLGEALISLGFINEETLSDFISRESNTNYIEISKDTVDQDRLNLIPYDIALKHVVIPIITAGEKKIACADVSDLDAVDAMRDIFGNDVQFAAASGKSINGLINIYYTHTDALYEIIDEIMALDIGEDSDSEYVVRLVDQVIAYAMKIRATDIHIEPHNDIYRIRVRVDGSVRVMTLLPASVGILMVSRIKVMSGLNPANRRTPQDGRMSISESYADYELRISILPTGSYNSGESVVIRLLDQKAMSHDISGLDMSEGVYSSLKDHIHSPYGLILVTGPTGAGKTTTLYSCLNDINSEENTVFTVEDPIESIRYGIQQIAVNADGGISFGVALREILRQDPDIIMVGEMRDSETAEIGVRAALTGHLVLSSLHTNNSVEAISRLIDMGIDPYIIASVLKGVLAQRLVRKVCTHCCKPDTMWKEKLGDIHIENPNFVVPDYDGCEFCNHTGFFGRIGVFEMLNITPELSEMISRSASINEFHHKLSDTVWRSMYDDALDKASKGITTISEITRVVGHA